MICLAEGFPMLRQHFYLALLRYVFDYAMRGKAFRQPEPRLSTFQRILSVLFFVQKPFLRRFFSSGIFEFYFFRGARTELANRSSYTFSVHFRMRSRILRSQ